MTILANVDIETEILQDQFVDCFRALLARSDLGSIGTLIADELQGQCNFLKLNREVKNSMWYYLSALKIEKLFKDLSFTYNI